MATATLPQALSHRAKPENKRRRAKPATLSPGQTVGTWKVERELGHGGMGSVYAITHKAFGKRAALKLCHRNVLGPSFTAEMFLREARVVNLIDHPGVPDVFATGTYDGRPYLAMERLNGQTLGQRLDTGPLPRIEALEILIELCDVLASAHAANVIHRDLKLDNVFVMATGAQRVKLLDWGIAHVVGEPDPLTGMVAGTLTTLAPEQIRGDELTPAADIYSLAVLAFQMLFGQPPFAAPRDLDLILMHLGATPPAASSLWSEIPAALATTLDAMLSKQPTERPALAAVVDAFRAARDDLKLAARLRSIPPPLPRPRPLSQPPVPFVLFANIRHNLLRVTLAAAVSITGIASLLS